MKRILSSLLLILLCTTSDLFATDLTVKKIDIAENGYINEPFPFKVTISNIREYAAELYTVTLTVRDKFNQVCHRDTVTGIDFPAFSDRDHTFRPFTTEYRGDYTAQVRVTYASDVNPSNDEASKSFRLIENTIDLIERGIAIAFIRALLESEGIYDELREEYQLHIQQTVTPANTSVVQTATRSGSVPYDTVAKLISDSWVAYFNTDKNARFGHPGTVVVLNAVDSSIKSYPVRNTVTVGGVVLGDQFNTQTLVAGTPPEVKTGSTNSVTTTAPAANPHDSVLVILVSGDPDNAKEGRSFKQDVEFMDLNLRLEQTGPRYPQSVIRKLDNPSPADILKLLDTMKGKYNHIVFFYSGHGDSVTQTGRDLGWMSTRDSALAYWQLFDGLYGTGAKNLEIIIDACHSGTAMAYVDYNEKYKDRNVTLITASSGGRVSYTNYYAPETKDTVGVGAFTLAFVQGYGNPNAETDGVPGASFVEAFQWVRIYGKDYRERWLDTLLDPQIHVHKAQTKKDTASSADSHVRITPTGTIQDNDVIRTTMSDGPPEVTSINASASYLSTGRYWTIENKGIKADYEFYVTPLWDSLPQGKDPSMLYLPEGATSWTAFDSSKYLAGSKSIMAYGVDFSAKWAVGVAIPTDPGSVESVDALRIIQLYPNPAKLSVDLTFNMVAPGNVTIELIDATGRSLGNLHSFSAAIGANHERVVLPQLSAGTYLLRVQSGDVDETLKLQIQ